MPKLFLRQAIASCNPASPSGQNDPRPHSDLFFTYRLQIGGVSEKLESPNHMQLLERHVRERITLLPAQFGVWPLPLIYEDGVVPRQAFIKVARIVPSSSLLSAGF